MEHGTVVSVFRGAVFHRGRTRGAGVVVESLSTGTLVRPVGALGPDIWGCLSAALSGAGDSGVMVDWSEACVEGDPGGLGMGSALGMLKSGVESGRICFCDTDLHGVGDFLSDHGIVRGRPGCMDCPLSSANGAAGSGCV